MSIWLWAALWEVTFGKKRAIDAHFLHRDWLNGHITDAEYRRKGGYMAKRYIEEKNYMVVPPKPYFRAPPAVGFRSRPFS